MYLPPPPLMGNAHIWKQHISKRGFPGLQHKAPKAHYLLHFSTSYDPSSQNRMACSLFIHSESVNSVSCHSSVRRVSSPSPSCALFFELLRTYAIKIEQCVHKCSESSVKRFNSANRVSGVSSQNPSCAIFLNS